MTSPDRTDELIREMLTRRTAGGPPADLLGRTLLALSATPRPVGASHPRAAPRPEQRRRLLLAATLVVAIPALIVALLGAGALIAPGPEDGGRGAAVGATPISSATSTGQAAASSPAASAATPPSSGASPDPGLAVGSLAAVTIEGDNLRVRSAPTTARSSKMLKPLLPAGTRMLIVDGPVAADGYDWYEVQTDGELIDLFGWVATGKDGETWLAPKGPRCPEDANAATVATLNRIDFLACYGRAAGPGHGARRGPLGRAPEAADCGWIRRDGSCDVDARWLLFPSASVTLVTDKGNEHRIDLAMPPDLAAALQGVPRQATLLLTISMDAPEAAACERPRRRHRVRGDPRPPGGHRVPAAVRRPGDRVAGAAGASTRIADPRSRRVRRWPAGRARSRPPRSRPGEPRGGAPTPVSGGARQAAAGSPSSPSIVQRRDRCWNVSARRRPGVSTSNSVRGPVIAG